MILVKDLKKTYGKEGSKVEALKSIHLHVQKGEVFGVIGLSGAGKSSLLRCISLLEKPDEGKILINGKDILTLNKLQIRENKKKIGIIFQHFNLLMNKTVYQNIAFPLEISGKKPQFIHEKVSELLRMVDLEDKKNIFPSMLSGGQKQRVGIARALANDPDILLCDEATSALDPQTTKSILHLLKTINRKLKITILLITHEMEVIKEICDKVAVLEHGKIIETGNVIDVFMNPKTETAKNFFRSVESDLDKKVYEKFIQSGKTMYKFIFKGDKSVNPYISNMIKNYNIQAAILAGNIQQVGDTLVGILVIDLDGSQDAIQKALAYIQKENIEVEVMKNVSRS